MKVDKYMEVPVHITCVSPSPLFKLQNAFRMKVNMK